MLRARTAKKDFTALPLTECLAKTYRNAHDVTAAGRTVLDHALITGAVAALLLERLPKCTLPFYPEGVDRIVSGIDPFSFDRMGKLVGDFQMGFQFSDFCFNGFFLYFQIYKLCKGILPLRV